MIKNLTGGAIINYGPTLPAPETTFDGALFYKTAGSDQGLYLFGFSQDANPGAYGDQSTQSWNFVQSSGLYVSKLGDIVNGTLSIVGDGASSDPYGRLAVTMPADANNYAYLGFTRQGHIGWSMGVDTSDRLFFGQGGGGGTANVLSRPMTLDTQGNLLINNNPVWHAGNDGVNSTLDAGLLGGQPPSFYTNAGNLTSGSLNVARLPFTPVQQGGGTGQQTNKLYIGFTSGSTLSLQVDATNFGSTWPISISGSASSATNANTANSATNATEATSARYLHSGATTNGTAMAFTWADPGGAPTYLWGGNAAGNQQIYQPINLTVGVAKNADQAAQLNNFKISGRTGEDFNSYRVSGMYAAEGSPANSVGGYSSVIVAANGDVGLQIAGGYNNDNMWFRGWNTSGANFSPWRSIIHSGNIASQSVALATRLGDNATLYGTTYTGRVLANAGSLQAPGFGFTNDTDTGILSGGDGNLVFAVDAQDAGRFQGTNFYVTSNITAGQNITAFSDKRLKKDIEIIPDAIDKVKQLVGVNFTRTTDESRGTGLIAQDVQAILPQAVIEHEDGMLSVAYGNLVGLLVESIKELNSKVEAMAAELSELKGK